MSTLARSVRGPLLRACLISCCWAFSFGLECPTASRLLQEAGRTESFIGISTAIHFCGVILGGACSVSLLKLHPRRMIALGLLFAGSGVLLLPHVSAYPGMGLRLLTGIGGAFAMIGIESLINRMLPEEWRARGFAVYGASIGIGFALGTFVGLHLFAWNPILAFVPGGVLPLASILLLIRLPRPEPIAREAGALPFSPPILSMMSAFVQGFLEVGTLAMMPVWLIANDWTDEQSGTLLGGILLGILLSQFPLGWLADHWNREKLIWCCFGTVLLGAILIPRIGTGSLLLVALLLTGIGTGAFYPLGLALLGERLPPAEIVRANAWYVGVNSIGSLVSPLLTGIMMEVFGRDWLFHTATIVLLLAALATWLGNHLIKASPSETV